MATFTDDFNRSNENPIAIPWSMASGPGLGNNSSRIVSNQFSGGVGTTFAVLNDLTFANDQSSSVVVTAGNSTGYFGPAVRASSNGDCYYVGWQEAQNRFKVAKRVGGTETEFANVGNTGFASGDTLGLSVSGNVLTVSINGVVYNTYTDNGSSLASGVVGIFAQGDVTRFDDFIATGITPAIEITDVDTDNIIEDGQQDVTLTTLGFASDITAVNLKVGTDRVALTNLSGTGDSYTANLMDVTALTSGTVGLPFSSATYQNEIEATDGTDTAVINITRNPKAGWEVVDVVDAVNTEGSTFENRVGGAPSNASQILYPTANGTSITATGIITTDAQEVDGYLWNVTSGEWETWSVDFPLPDTTTSTAQVTITGIANGTHAIKLWNDATNAILFNGNLTFTDTTATTSLDVAAGTVFVGRWLGDNPPTTGTGIYGVTV